jgi:hypothetical protein
MALQVPKVKLEPMASKVSEVRLVLRVNKEPRASMVRLVLRALKAQLVKAEQMA